MSDTLSLTTRTFNGVDFGRLAHHPIRGDYAIAVVTVTALSLLFIAINRSVFHWFICLQWLAEFWLAWISCAGCAGAWSSSIQEQLSPVWHFMVSWSLPILHVIWDRFGVGDEMAMFGDWRPWLGGMAALNALGLLAYRVAHNQAFSGLLHRGLAGG